jgi:hypothetical protein
MFSSTLRSRADLKSLVLAVKTAVGRNLPITEKYLEQAFARGFELNTHSGLLTTLDAGLTLSLKDFRALAFIDRLAELSGDRFMAEAAAAAVFGVSLEIAVVKRPPARQVGLGLGFDIEVKVVGLPGDALAETPNFVVPADFRSPAIRIESDHAFKVDGEFPVTRNRDLRELLTAKIIKGTWRGVLYLSAPPDADEARYIRSVTAALAREIMTAVNPWIRCRVFWPDHYDKGAWHAEVSLGHAAQTALHDSRIVFDIPQHKRRLVIPEKGYLFDLNPDRGVFAGQLVDGTWRGDVYSNGIAEDDNPVPIEQFRAELMRNVATTLRHM